MRKRTSDAIPKISKALGKLIRDEWKIYHLLVVDDDPDMVTSICDTLRQAGLQAHGAHSGEAALHILAKQPVRVIISDQRMTGMTGIAFLKEAKQRYPQREMVTMLLTAYNVMDVVVAALNEAGASQYLTKPWEPEALLEKVAKALEIIDLRTQMQHIAGSKRWMLCQMAQTDNFNMFGAFGDFMHTRFGTLAKSLPKVMPALIAAYQGARLSAKQGHDPVDPILEQALRVQDDAPLFAAVLQQIALVGENFATLEPRQRYQKQSPVPILEQEFLKAKESTLALKSAMRWAFSFEVEDDIPALWLNAPSFVCALHQLLENAIIYNLGAVPQGTAREVTVRAGFFTPRSLQRSGRRTIERQPPEVLKQDTFWVEIEDSGKGMAACDVERRFQFFNTEVDQEIAAFSGTCAELSPFQDEYNLTKYLHIGMGLPVAQWCINSHDGNLRLLNPGRNGACFRIDIPLKQTQLRHRLGLD